MQGKKGEFERERINTRNPLNVDVFLITIMHSAIQMQFKKQYLFIIQQF